MLLKIDNSEKGGNDHIKILYPGNVLNQKDTGFGSIGRIDHATLKAGSFIPMHPHVNDEILSYFRTGKVKHSDSEGFSEYIEPKRVMLMKAGRSFFHEEKVLDDSEPLEGLQIFIRPKEKDLQPEVIFQELDSIHSENKWRLLASPDPETKLQFSSDTLIYDITITHSEPFTLPDLPNENLSSLLYVFQGEILVNDEITLKEGDSLIIENEKIVFVTQNKAELVVFVTNTNGKYYEAGMYSGNQYQSISGV